MASQPSNSGNYVWISHIYFGLNIITCIIRLRVVKVCFVLLCSHVFYTNSRKFPQYRVGNVFYMIKATYRCGVYLYHFLQLTGPLQFISFCFLQLTGKICQFCFLLYLTLLLMKLETGNIFCWNTLLQRKPILDGSGGTLFYSYAIWRNSLCMIYTSNKVSPQNYCKICRS